MMPMASASRIDFNTLTSLLSTSMPGGYGSSNIRWSTTPARDFYYSSNWQVLEERSLSPTMECGRFSTIQNNAKSMVTGSALRPDERQAQDHQTSTGALKIPVLARHFLILIIRIVNDFHSRSAASLGCRVRG